MAIWARRCHSVGCYEARRHKRGHACAFLVGIATGRAGMDHVCRGAHLVLDQGCTIRVRRNGRGRQKKHRVLRGAAPIRHQLHAGRGAGLFRTRSFVAHRVNNFAADIGKRLPIVVTHHEEAGRSSTDHGDGKRRIVIANRAMSALGQKQTSD